MRFDTQQHQASCGIDLPARTLYVCIVHPNGESMVHHNANANPETFRKVIAPYRDDMVVAVACIFTWYWLADLCAREGIAFVLGHALSLKALHGGTAKNDRGEAQQMAVRLRGGMLPQAYGSPAAMRAPRARLRRRLHCLRKRAAFLPHVQNTNRQYTLPAIGKKMA